MSRRCVTLPEVARIRELRYIDGLTCGEVSAVTGVSVSTVRDHAPGRPGKIDNAKLRDAFRVSGASAVAVAYALGWTYVERTTGRVRADDTRVKRTLGLIESSGGHPRYRQHRRLIDAGTAGLIADAIGVGRWEVGA